VCVCVTDPVVFLFSHNIMFRKKNKTSFSENINNLCTKILKKVRVRIPWLHKRKL